MAEYQNPFAGQANPFEGQANPYQGQANPYIGVKNPFIGENPYLQQNIDKAQGDVVRNYNMTAQPAYNTAMVKSGSFGNEGVQQMNENAQKNLQGSLGDISNNMRMQDYQNQQNMYMQQQSHDASNYLANRAQDSNNYLANRAQDIGSYFNNRSQDISNYQWDQGFNRQLYNDAYSQNMNNLTTGVGLLGTLSGYNANDLTNANSIQNTPLNYWSNFSNQANGMGQGYGSTTGTVGTSSNPVMSALGGAQLGQSAMGWWNNQNGGGAPKYGADGSNFGSNLTQQTGTYNTGSFYG